MVNQIKVAMIPDATRIVINCGSEDTDSVYVGREIEVYLPGQEIIDPDSKEVIGTYDLVKDRLEITSVYATYSVARKIKEEKRSLVSIISSPMLAEKTYVSYDSIDVDNEDNLNLKIENKTIKVGDFVKLV